MIKLSVNETKWSILLAWTRALILYILIWIFDFGPVKLQGLSRNGPQNSCIGAVEAAILFMVDTSGDLIQSLDVNWVKENKLSCSLWMVYSLKWNQKFSTRLSKIIPDWCWSIKWLKHCFSLFVIVKEQEKIFGKHFLLPGNWKILFCH